MKIIFVLVGLLCTPLVVSSALAEICGPDHEHEEDKQKHLLVSSLIGLASSTLSQDRLISYSLCLGVGFLLLNLVIQILYKHSSF